MSVFLKSMSVRKWWLLLWNQMTMKYLLVYECWPHLVPNPNPILIHVPISILLFVQECNREKIVFDILDQVRIISSTRPFPVWINNQPVFVRLSESLVCVCLCLSVCPRVCVCVMQTQTQTHTLCVSVCPSICLSVCLCVYDCFMVPSIQ